MQDYNPFGWIEIPVNDLQRAQTFYEAVFQIKMEVHSMGGLEMIWFPSHEEAVGAPGTLIKGKAYTPSHEGPLVYMTAPDLDAHSKRVSENGGKVLQTKFSIGDYGFVAIIEDTEGNRIALHSREG